MFRKNILALTILIFLSAGLLQAQDEENDRIILQEFLMINDRCTLPPCLFGHSLQGMNYNQVQHMIGILPMRDTLVLIDAPRRTIRWAWSSELSSILGVNIYPKVLSDDDYHYINEFNGFNSISFRDGIADGVWLRFETQLSTLVQVYGEPLLADPLSYTRFGDMTFRIFFADVEGYFTAITRCDAPELYASTRIRGYLSTADELYISNESIQWQGYTKDLPNCSIFQP